MAKMLYYSGFDAVHCIQALVDELGHHSARRRWCVLRQRSVSLQQDCHDDLFKAAILTRRQACYKVKASYNIGALLKMWRIPTGTNIIVQVCGIDFFRRNFGVSYLYARLHISKEPVH